MSRVRYMWPFKSCLAFMVLLHLMSCESQMSKCALEEPIPIFNKYFQEGDLIIGAITLLAAMPRDPFTFSEDPQHAANYEPIILIKHYQHILALVFAVKEINEDIQIIPNVTLGFNIYDSDGGRLTYHATMELFSSAQRLIPNYNYGNQNNLISVIGALHMVTSLDMADILEIYKVPQLYHFLKKISFNNSAGDRISFDETGGLVTGFDITNWITFPNQSFQRVKVGKLHPQSSENKTFTIQEETITWHSSFNQTVPISVCTDSCPPGYYRQKQEGKALCCYNCLRCPAGEISSQKDMDDCSECPEDHYPSQDQNTCILKRQISLSFEDPLGIILATLALSLSLCTILVIGIFLKHHNTPIVKANNRELSYALLVSLLLCFLCTLQFIVTPSKIVCLLRQTTFGVLFSIAVSCVLAKTIIVVLAFMATKPDSRLKKWVGKGLAYLIITSFSLVQAGICTVWLSVSPPFPDVDMFSEKENMVLMCNEGSPTMFYSVLGYMGFLAAASFTVAFLARKLPSTFNEAKFISFSMLVFCSVWLSFVPSYLSTKGKQMVAVEIFSILASSAGLLCCIFFPKCYIMILRPEQNSRKQLAKKSNF